MILGLFGGAQANAAAGGELGQEFGDYVEFTGFCVPPAEAERQFDEALDVLIEAWTSKERFSHHGRCR